MKKLILILPIFLSGCLYINNGVGLTTFQYDRCKEYYDGSGKYHHECPKSVIEKSGDAVEKGVEKAGKVTKCIAKKTKDFFYSFGKEECENRKNCAK